MSMDPMERVRARIVFKHIFWASLAAGMQVIATDNYKGQPIKTAATNMRQIFYNPAWFNAQSSGVQEFTFVHEIAHKFALHDFRQGHRHPKLWNIAGDHEINLRLKDAGFEIWKEACCNSKYHELSAEQIYELEKKKLEAQGGSGQDADGVPGVGEDLILEPMTPQEQEAHRIEVMTRVAQAAMLAEQAGQMSAGLRRFVDSILHPKEPWWDQLRAASKRLVRADESWSIPSRRTQSMGVYLPSPRAFRMGEVIIINDTSGSISNEDLKLFGGISMDVFEELQPASIRVIWWDSQLCGEQEFGMGERPELEPAGGGGTAMDRALQYVEDNYQPDACVLVTDGETAWPDHEMPFPLIVLTTNKPAPIGVTIRVSPA